MNKKIIYYDLEATALQPDKAKIIEIGAYNPETNETFCRFVNPQCPIPAETTAITSITTEMVSDAPIFEVIGKEFSDFCGPRAYLIAHNNDKFDKPLLTAEYSRANLMLPDWKYIDSLKWSRKYRPDLPSHSLQTLREFYGFSPNQAHRALDDVMVLYQIFSLLIDDLSIETVYELLYPPSGVYQMPFGKHQGKKLSEIPSNYFQWLKSSGALDKAENLELKEAIAKIRNLNS